MILGEEGCKEQSGKKHQGKKKDFNRFLEVKETMADRAGQMMVNFSCQLGQAVVLSCLGNKAGLDVTIKDVMSVDDHVTFCGGDHHP